MAEVPMSLGTVIETPPEFAEGASGACSLLPDTAHKPNKYTLWLHGMSGFL